MKALIQRVSQASVTSGGVQVAEIGKGLLVLLGIKKGDNDADSDYMIEKILNLRVFESESGKLDYSVKDINGEILVVSQFTLYGDCSKGRRPDFAMAESPQQAEKIYNSFIQKISEHSLKVATGNFRTYMQVALVNDGPVTIALESKS